MHLPTFYLLVPRIEIGRKHILSDKQFWLKAWGISVAAVLSRRQLPIRFKCGSTHFTLAGGGVGGYEPGKCRAWNLATG